MNAWLPARQCAALAGNTALEIVRHPLILLLTVSGTLLTGLLPAFAVFALGEEARLVRDGALAVQFLVGLLVASVAASATIHADLRRGTAATVLCKPVSRGVYLLAVTLGLAGVLLLVNAILMMAGLLSSRMALRGLILDGRVMALFMGGVAAAFLAGLAANLGCRRPFTAWTFGALAPCLAAAVLAVGSLDAGAAGHGGDAPVTGMAGLIRGGLPQAGVLVALASLVLGSLAIALSVRLPPLLSGAACGALFLLGLVSESLFRAASATSLPAWLAWRLLPNWQLFWMADALSDGGRVSWAYVAGAGGYAACYAGAALALGMLVFRRADVV